MYEFFRLIMFTFDKLFLLFFLYLIFLEEKNFLFPIAEAVASCSCNNSNPFNLSNNPNETINFSNPFDSPCADYVQCIWYIYREIEDPRYMIEINLQSNFSRHIDSEPYLEVYYCDDSVYTNNTNLHYALINNNYPYYVFDTMENSLCVRFITQGYYANESWQLQFTMKNAPTYLRYDLRINPIYWLQINETSDYIYTGYVADSVHFVDVWVPVDLTFNTPSDVFICYMSSSLKHFMSYINSYPGQPIDGCQSDKSGIMSILRSKYVNYYSNYSDLVFRSNIVLENCNSNDLQSAIRFGNGTFSDIIRTKIVKFDPYIDPYTPQCLYTVIVQKNRPNIDSNQLYYLNIKNLFLEAASATYTTVKVTTRTMNQTIELFEFDNDTINAWTNVMVFGTVIGFDIPPSSRFSIKGTVESGPNFNMFIDANTKTNGVLMSPYFADFSDNQSVNYSLTCRVCKEDLIFSISIISLDLPNDSILHIWNDSYHIEFTNKTSEVNSSIVLYGSAIRVEYNAPYDSNGFLLRYEAQVPPKKKNNFALIIEIVAPTILLLIISVTAGGFILYRRRLMLKREELQEESAPIPTTSTNQTQITHLNFSLNSLSSPNMFINPKLMKLMGNESVNALTFSPNEQIYAFDMDELQDLGLLEACPNIVDLYGLCFHGGYALLCMELMNLSLKDLYLVVHKNEENFPEQLVVCVAVKVIDALIYCKSKNIIHRDIKPSNILVNYSGEIKLCDFGESRIMENSFASSNVGTLAYWPPEHFLGIHKKYDFRSDVWSLGITLMEVILGKLPYLMENIHHINNRNTQFYGSDLIITQFITHSNLPAIIDEHIEPNYSTMLSEFLRLCTLKIESRPKLDQLISTAFYKNFNVEENEISRLISKFKFKMSQRKNLIVIRHGERVDFNFNSNGFSWLDKAFDMTEIIFASI